MGNYSSNSKPKHKLKCLGTGLVTLDLVYKPNSTQPYTATGGSCGNIMSILSKDGWGSYPASELGKDIASELVIADLKKMGVNVDFITRSNMTNTPVIIEFIKQNHTGYEHTFSRKCHKTNIQLPRYKSISQDKLDLLTERISEFDVYFFDRLDLASFLLAKAAHNAGKIVFFEPQHIENSEIFSEVFKYVDILKVSEQLVSTNILSVFEKTPYLTIVTKGKDGLSFRYGAFSFYTYLEAPHVDAVKDASGCGDWLSASLIDTLCRHGKDSFRQNSHHAVVEAIKHGQKRSAKNLKFWGARGGMYKSSFLANFHAKNYQGIKVTGDYLKITNKEFKPSDLLAYF